VLSGFLISRILLDELRQTGGIDFAGFYARRVRRLLPALATVVAVTLVAGAFILSPALEQPELARSAVAAMAFVSNIYFWDVQDAYFVTPTEWLPLLHLWTLSVEEQFYLLWPALLLLAAWFGRRRGRSISVIGLPLLASLFLASFVLLTCNARSWPVAAFYLTPMRGWEFALGGLLALTDGRLRHIAGVGAPVAALGLAGIAVAAMQPQGGWSFSVTIAALGATLVIAGITASPASLPSRLLALRPMAIVGRLSYSWYLWHWPLLAFTRVSSIGAPSLARTLSAAVVALALAAITFVFIEDPIRRRRPWPFSSPTRTLAAGGALSLTLAALAGGLLVQANAAVRRDSWLASIVAAADTMPKTPGCNFAFEPPTLAPASRCTLGIPGSAPKILVWGDSYAEHLKALMEADGRRGGYASALWSKSACRPATPDPPVQSAACDAFNRAVLDELPRAAQAGAVGLVVASSNFDFPKRPIRAADLDQWASGMRYLLSQARALDLRVLIVAPIPNFLLPLPQCLLHASAAQCGRRRSELKEARVPLIAALHALAAGDDNTRVWDPFDLFCDAQSCTPLRNGTIMYSDQAHLSVAGSRALEPFAAPSLDWLRGAR
jgi:peptidoglycan/LPS O-acetylase OafA/YrhL